MNRRLVGIATSATLAIGGAVAGVVLAGPALAAPVICEQFGTTTVQSRYVVMNNRWGASTEQCIDVNQSGGFTVTVANHNNATNGAPAAYPAIYYGCHYANCSPGTILPLQINTSQYAGISSSVTMSYPGSGTYDAAYDIWYDPTPRRDGQNTGAEIMIWLNKQGSIQPIGSRIGSASLAGGTWDVWFGNVGWNVISYVRTSATTSLNFSASTFSNDAMSRGYVQSSWYLTSMQAGFEPWIGGAGLAVTSFSVTTGTGGGDTQAPSTPANLAAAGVTASGANLSWSASTDNVGVTGYTVLRRQGTTGTYTQVGTSAGTSFAATGLAASTQYQFVVTARDAAGNTSGQSTPVTVTTTGGGGGDTQAPSVPTNLTGSNVTSSGVNLAWNASTDNVGVTGYNILRRQGTSGTYTQVGTSTSTSFAATGLTASTLYQFVVSARDAAGNTSGQSTPVTVTTSSGGSTGGPVSCRVTWAANTWQTGFTVNVTITNTGTSPIDGWALSWTFPGNQQITSAWNASVTPVSGAVTARNMSYNNVIPPGGSQSFGFQGTYSGSNPTPSAFTLNGTACTVG
jgi:chitodextrinase